MKIAYWIFDEDDKSNVNIKKKIGDIVEQLNIKNLITQVKINENDDLYNCYKGTNCKDLIGFLKNKNDKDTIDYELMMYTLLQLGVSDKYIKE